MGLAKLSSELRLTEYQHRSRNGNDEIVADVLAAIRQIVRQEIGAAFEAEAKSNTKFTEVQTRECGLLKSFWKFATNMFTKN